MLWRKWRTCTNLMTIAYIQCREKQLSIKGCPKRYSCDGLHCFCIVRPGRLGVFMCFGDSSLPTAFVYMKSWTKTHHTDRIVCFEMLIQWCLSLPLWLSSFFASRLRLWKLRFRFWLCKESDAGMAKANLGSFLSLVMVTFEIGSESCQNFLEILHETNRFVNRSHATVSLQFSIQECGNCGRQFLRSSSELQDDVCNTNKRIQYVYDNMIHMTGMTHMTFRYTYCTILWSIHVRHFRHVR